MSETRRQFDWSVLQPAAVDTPAPVKSADPAPAEREEVGEGAEAASDRSSRPSDAPLIALRVNDLKQFTYCARIVFYQYVMPVERKATFKMEHGKVAEARVQQLEQRRTLHRYGLGDGTRQFQLWLTSPRLALSGRLDLLVRTDDEAVPVDFKDTNSRVHHNHHVQLCAYALLVEDAYGGSVRRGFVYRVPQDDVTIIEMTPALRDETVRALDAVRTMIVAERMPEPTEVRARCDDCEYRNYCGDVF
jgi:CRISPR-associated exonuclease Cas4